MEILIELSIHYCPGGGITLFFPFCLIFSISERHGWKFSLVCINDLTKIIFEKSRTVRIKWQGFFGTWHSKKLVRKNYWSKRNQHTWYFRCTLNNNDTSPVWFCISTYIVYILCPTRHPKRAHIYLYEYQSKDAGNGWGKSALWNLCISQRSDYPQRLKLPYKSGSQWIASVPAHELHHRQLWRK